MYNTPSNIDNFSNLASKIDRAEIGIPLGIAPLDGTGKVNATYLPSYVDEVVEVANFAALPGTGVSGVIYLTIDTSNSYRWGGASYVQVSSPHSMFSDILLVLNKDGVTDVSASGGGLSIIGASNKSLTWSNSTKLFESNQGFSLTGVASENNGLLNVVGSASQTSDILSLKTSGAVDLFKVKIGGEAQLINGAVGAPSIGFLNDPNTGIYSFDADILGFTAGGVNTLQTTAAQVLHFAGTAALPGVSFITDPNTGVMTDNSDTLSLVTSGIRSLAVSPLGTVRVGDAAGTSVLNATSMNLQIASSTTTSRLLFNTVATGLTSADGYEIGFNASSNEVFSNAQETSTYHAWYNSGQMRMRLTNLGTLVVGSGASSVTSNTVDTQLFLVGSTTSAATARFTNVTTHGAASSDGAYIQYNNAGTMIFGTQETSSTMEFYTGANVKKASISALGTLRVGTGNHIVDSNTWPLSLDGGISGVAMGFHTSTSGYNSTDGAVIGLNSAGNRFYISVLEASTDFDIYTFLTSEKKRVTVLPTGALVIRQTAGDAEAGVLLLEEKDTTPANPTASTECKVYVKANKLVIQFNDAGTVRYNYLDMTSTLGLWTYTTTAP